MIHIPVIASDPYCHCVILLNEPTDKSSACLYMLIHEWLLTCFAIG